MGWTSTVEARLYRSANMSTAETDGQGDEGEYGRAAKRPKMEEKEDRAEDELEEGEDSDSGSLPGTEEVDPDRPARWSGWQFGSGRKVRIAGMFLPNGTAKPGTRARAHTRLCCCCLSES